MSNILGSRSLQPQIEGSELESMLQSLDECIKRVHLSVNMVENKFSPVLSACPPEQPSNAVGITKQSDTTQRLYEFYSSLENVNGKLNSL